MMMSSNINCFRLSLAMFAYHSHPFHRVHSTSLTIHLDLIGEICLSSAYHLSVCAVNAYHLYVVSDIVLCNRVILPFIVFRLLVRVDRPIDSFHIY